MRTVKSKLQLAIAANRPVLLIGQPGVGKTDVCASLAEEMGYDFLVEIATTADPTDARGLPAVIDGRADYMPYGIMRSLIEATRPTLCLIDDLGHASMEVQKAYMHLVLARKAGQHSISPHVRFIAATNDVGQKAGVSTIISPLQNRFFQVPVQPNVPTWCEWAQQHQLSPEVIAFVRSTPALFDKWAPPVGIEATCTPRSVHMLSDFVHAGANHVDIYAGCVGRSIAMQFMAYRNLYRELPNIHEILAKPTKAQVPKELDRQYAICSALATQESGWERILVYLGRLPMEMAVLTVSDATTRRPELLEDADIRKWMKANSATLL